MEAHVEHFYKTGKLLNGTYYFDPPLIEPEIRELHNILAHIKGNKVILNPLRDDVRYTGNYNRNRTLLWLDVVRNEFIGWQNVDSDEDEQGEYVLENLQTIKRWCKNECVKPFRNGRLFLAELPNTEDIFNQLNESDEFDWVDTNLNLSGVALYNAIENYFSTYHNDRYWLENDYGMVYIQDNTGIYTDMPIEDFTIENLKDKIKISILRTNGKTKKEYIDLAKTLEPIIGSFYKNF